MSDPKAYSLSRLDAQDEIQYRIIEARRATAKTALLQVIDKQRAKRIARPTVGALSRDFDRQYHDLLESLLIRDIDGASYPVRSETSARIGLR
ncbi:MAG: hypothetical protein IPM59_15435 [Chloracidobacterium sp.]|nr:hypothetical protein [Chloracidobacterium sp.]